MIPKYSQHRLSPFTPRTSVEKWVVTVQQFTLNKNRIQYIAGFPSDVQGILQKIRKTIKKATPDAEETIKYGMPTFTLKGNLVYFAAFKKHIGFYPPPAARDAKFKKELAPYQGPKGTLRFPLDEPIPFGLISRIVKQRVKENLARADGDEKKRSGA